jgi:double-stranded uracil-DNA glycosylase
VARLDSTT